MAAAEKLEYPSSGSVTNSWTPSHDADINGSDETYNDGVIADQSSGSTEYRYAEGVQTEIYRRMFRQMTATDKSNFLAFRALVLGETVKFTDYAGSTHTVSFVPGPTRFQPEEGALWTWEVLLREEL